MRVLGDSRCALTSCMAAAMLAGCGGSTTAAFNVPASDAPNTLAHHHTFHYTGKEQSFVVPAGITRISVVARGAAGNGYSHTNSYGYYEYFGRGGRVFAIIPVQEGEKLYIFVGGKGTSKGGFNGGGNPGGEASRSGGYGGGGASDLREGGDALHDRVLVAGGGGGQGYGWNRNPSCNGGKGGGPVGGAGAGGGSYDCGGGGSGGTQKSGGAGGSGASGSQPGEPGDPGSLGRAGNGGLGGYGTGSSQGGGVGGGGGSSYVELYATKFASWQGWKNATSDGLVVFSWE